MRVRFTPGSLEGIKFDGTPQGYEGANGLEHKGAWPHYRGVIPGYFNNEVVNVVTADGQVELFVEFATFEERRKPLLVGLKVDESPDLGAVAALAEYDNPNHRNMAKIRTHFFDRVAAEPVLPPGQELPEVAQKLQECVDRARSAVLALGEKEAELHNLMTYHRRNKTMVPPAEVARLKAEHKALIKPVIDAYAAKDWPVGRLPADSIHYYGPNAPLTAEGFRKSEIDGRDQMSSRGTRCCTPRATTASAPSSSARRLAATTTPMRSRPSTSSASSGSSTSSASSPTAWTARWRSSTPPTR